nr:moricin-like peptide 4 [Antheraea pernyi]
MKFFNLFIVVLALVALMGGVDASPKGVGNAIRKGGKVIKHGLSAIGIIGTGHQIYQESQNQG